MRADLGDRSALKCAAILVAEVDNRHRVIASRVYAPPITV
jgi:hypothetical protein